MPRLISSVVVYISFTSYPYELNRVDDPDPIDLLFQYTIINGYKKVTLREGNDNMRTETYEIVMPEKCRVMTEEEMEYEGGFLNFIAAAVCSVASIGCSALAAATGNKDLERLSIGLDVASVALSCGVTACVSLAGKTAAKAVTSKVIKSTINAGNKVGTLNGLISADDYMVASKVLDYTLSKPLTGVTAVYKHCS